MPQNVVLPGPAPWGFRLSGGIDFNQPLIITRVGVFRSFAASGDAGVRPVPLERIVASEAVECAGWVLGFGPQFEGRQHLGKLRFGDAEQLRELTTSVPLSAASWPPTTFRGEITPGSKAAAANLSPGDVILAIDGFGTESMTHADAQDRIKAAAHQLCLKIDRGCVHSRVILKAAAALQVRALLFRVGDLKVAAKMAPNIPLEMELPGVKIVHAQFNTPMQLYSDDNIMETLQGQVSTALGETPSMSEPTASVPPESDVYRMLHDNRNEPAQPRQSGSFRVLQELVNDGPDDRPAGTRSVRAPVTKVHGGAGSTQRMPLCDKCGSGIVGAVVKARDKYRHPECFVCADCNLNLKQKGYFFVEGELYCETHARARMRPPEGYDTVTLYPKA
ncbi:PDZ and LIM domain protein 3 [Camelus ferus]|nr:PDZ and LIM domain protein 3 [Camelus ferus]